MSTDPKQSHRWGCPTSREERGYGLPHIRIRRQLLKEEPNCRLCADLGVVTKACVADHIVPKCLGGPSVRANYQSLCLTHSRSKSGREGNMMRQARKRARLALEAKLSVNG